METHETSHFKKAGLLALVISVVCFISWEGYWRNRGFTPTFNDDDSYWAHKRKQVYQDPAKTTVFIGSSRIKFDLDADVWKEVTGEEAVQLSLVGTNPRPLLSELANDEKFKGKLVVDVTEDLFFSMFPGVNRSAINAINYYKKLTPSQQISFQLAYGLESGIVTLEEEKFSLGALFTDLSVKNRPGVMSMPPFPKEFELMKESRQNFMLEAFLKDTLLQKRQTDIWASFGALDSTEKGIRGDSLARVFAILKKDIDKIKARGGSVLFVRTPASGPYEHATRIAYAQEMYWDAMLEHTAAPGIHYRDYPETAGYICPEWSHLSPEDAKDYTRKLAAIMQQKGWFSSYPIAKF